MRRDQPHLVDRWMISDAIDKHKACC